jgi:hypothetical protein
MTDQSREWNGKFSAKFTGGKRMIEQPDNKGAAHPIYSIPSKRHFNKPLSEEYQFKPTIKLIGAIDHENDK